MRWRGRPAALQHAEEPHQVGVDVGLGVFEGIADPRLCGQVYDAAGMDGSENLCGGFPVRQVEPVMLVARTGLKPRQACELQTGVIIRADVVDTHHALAPVEKGVCDVEPDEAGRACDQNHETASCNLTPQAAINCLTPPEGPGCQPASRRESGRQDRR